MKFYEAYNAEYYSERITNKSKKHMMKYMKFLRKGFFSENARCRMR